MKAGTRYIHRVTGDVLHVKSVGDTILTTRGEMSREWVEKHYFEQKRPHYPRSIRMTDEEKQEAIVKHGSLRACFLEGLKTTYPTDPLPFNEWAQNIRQETDKEYNISADKLSNKKK